MLLQKKKIPHSQIIYMDETPLSFDSSANRTVEETGSRIVFEFMTGHERTSFTCALACVENGDKLKSMIIF